MRISCPQLVVSALVIALSCFTVAQQSQQSSHNNPLIELLQSKGIITPQEAAAVNQADTAEEANNQLAKLLIAKGLISEKEYAAALTPVASKEKVEATVTPVVLTPKEYEAALTPVAVKPKTEHSATARLFKAVYTPQPVLTSSSYQTTQTAVAPPVAKETPIIPAVAPLRVLPIDLPKQGGMIPDIKLGSGANMKIYGFYKASAVSDTASSGGATFGSQDWPLPLLLGDTGPTSDPQVHIKARSFRIGAQTEWVPKGSDFTITGRVEADFEGDYTDVSNRNISSARSNEFTLRLAWARLDHKIGGVPWFAEFGQDWSLISSSLPNLFETTGLAIGMGALWERMPMFKTGVQFHSGDFKVQPEFAIVLPIAGSAGLTTDQRLRFGDRAGSESNQPGLEARVVFQFPLSHKWKGVAPAQLIFSGHHARINEIIPHAAQLPTSVTCTVLPCTVSVFTSATVPNLGFTTSTTILNAANCGGASCNLEQLFPRGVQDGNPQYVYTGEIQLPTPWVTFVAKFYRGTDMRFFFAGQLNDVFANLHGLFNVGNGVSESGRAITFGCAGGTAAGQPANTVNCQGTPVLAAKLQPIGGTGGFVELSFPLSRIFRANPEGANSGWILHLQYGTDRANYAEAQFGNHLGRTDLDTASLTYRLNKWVTFVHEASYINTFTANNHAANGAITIERLPFMGLTTRQAHNWRNEFGPIFTF
jgi:hypothetical protein